MADFSRYILGMSKLPKLLFLRIASNPMGVFVYSILSKWYVITTVAAISVTFWVFSGLQKAGVIDSITESLTFGFDTAKAVAQHCTPLITDLPKMFDCIDKVGPKDYNPEGTDDNSRAVMENELKNTNPNGYVDPYSAP